LLLLSGELPAVDVASRASVVVAVEEGASVVAPPRPCACCCCCGAGGCRELGAVEKVEAVSDADVRSCE
jgi:hypothetical protein